MKGLSVIIVDGGAGLGALLAQMVVGEGATGLCVIDLNCGAAEASLTTARNSGLPAVAIEADISTGPGAYGAFNRAVEVMGRVDTMVNAVEIYPRKPLLEITDNDWDAFNAFNVKGTYHMMVAHSATYA